MIKELKDKEIVRRDVTLLLTAISLIIFFKEMWISFIEMLQNVLLQLLLLVSPDGVSLL